MSYLRALCLVVSNTYSVCFCFVCLRLMYPMLLVSLDCPLLVAPLVFSNVYAQCDFRLAEIGKQNKNIRILIAPTTVNFMDALD